MYVCKPASGSEVFKIWPVLKIMGPHLKLLNLILCNANHILKWMNRLEMLLPRGGELPSGGMYIADLPAFVLPLVEG